MTEKVFHKCKCGLVAALFISILYLAFIGLFIWGAIQVETQATPLAIVALVVTVGAVSFGGAARKALMSDGEAVVLSTAAVVKASPEKTGKDLFILHEGTKVEVLDTFGEWSEIRIADGNEGWIRTSAIEVI